MDFWMLATAPLPVWVLAAYLLYRKWFHRYVSMKGEFVLC
jgi:hypothetical protein